MVKMVTWALQGPDAASALTGTSDTALHVEPQHVKTGGNLRSLLVQPPAFADEETEAQRSRGWLIENREKGSQPQIF